MKQVLCVSIGYVTILSMVSVSWAPDERDSTVLFNGTVLARDLTAWTVDLPYKIKVYVGGSMCNMIPTELLMYALESCLSAPY